ncbi:MAG: hypothetical protein HRU13_09725 [Phycisphaerales bacterium]|nr:hypothetical protein [Phycisphaerales bacterium]
MANAHIIHRALAPGVADDPLSVADDPALAAWFVPFWEGGGAPAALAARAQNPTLADGAPFATLTDWSSHGHHATQTDAAIQPTWDASERALVTSAPGARMDTPAIELDYRTWVYAVYECVGALGAQAVVVEHGDNSAATPGFQVSERYGAPGSFLIGYPTGGGPPIGLFGRMGDGLPGAYEALEWQTSPQPQGRAVLVNGVPIVPLFNGRTPVESTNTLPLRLFSRFSAGTPIAPILGRLRMLAVGSAALGAAARAQVRAVGQEMVG